MLSADAPKAAVNVSPDSLTAGVDACQTGIAQAASAIAGPFEGHGFMQSGQDLEPHQDASLVLEQKLRLLSQLRSQG